MTEPYKSFIKQREVSICFMKPHTKNMTKDFLIPA